MIASPPFTYCHPHSCISRLFLNLRALFVYNRKIATKTPFHRDREMLDTLRQPGPRELFLLGEGELRAVTMTHDQLDTLPINDQERGRDTLSPFPSIALDTLRRPGEFDQTSWGSASRKERPTSAMSLANDWEEVD